MLYLFFLELEERGIKSRTSMLHNQSFYDILSLTKTLAQIHLSPTESPECKECEKLEKLDLSR